jgi:hypothetical protein
LVGGKVGCEASGGVEATADDVDETIKATIEREDLANLGRARSEIG